MGNLETRVEALERQIGGDTPVVFKVVYEGEVLTPEEEAVLQKYKEEMIAAAKPGEFLVIFWTQAKVRELLATPAPC